MPRAKKVVKKAAASRRSRREVDEIEVKVARTGGEVKAFLLEEGASVEEALEASGVSYDKNDRIRVNGKSAELEDELSDGDIVTLAGKIKGGK